MNIFLWAGMKNMSSTFLIIYFQSEYIFSNSLGRMVSKVIFRQERQDVFYFLSILTILEKKYIKNEKI